MAKVKSARKEEYGDFQTPRPLARAACRVLRARGLRPAAIVEPTCGQGSFLAAALSEFPDATTALGLEINPSHLAAARTLIGRVAAGRSVTWVEGDYFTTDWGRLLAPLPDPLLVVGNPPWVTSAAVGSLGGTNLPEKSNFQNLPGLAARTGKSNFDISEWMLLQALTWLGGRDAALGMLCKTAVARRVLQFAWSKGVRLTEAALYRIDAREHFAASVEACFLFLRFGPSGGCFECRDFARLGDCEPVSAFGYRCGQLVADVAAFERSQYLLGESPVRWRSGIKHDCAKVFELRREGGSYRNGLGERVKLEPDFVYPMMKSSEVAAPSAREPSRWMLVTQTQIQDDTTALRHRAPKTWRYLTEHAPALQRRGSSIYRNRPPFSVFGVGEYTFAPWKVATSGLYKTLGFRTVGPYEGRPVVFDDTCYFLPCGSQTQAEAITQILHSGPARDFFAAQVFWDAKRPITADLLQRLDLIRLAAACDVPAQSLFATASRVHADGEPPTADRFVQGTLFS